MTGKNSAKKSVCIFFIVLMAFLSSATISAATIPTEQKTSVELSFSISWTFGCYKETTFANISQDFLSPRIQLDTKIYSGNFMHKITLDYFSCKPESAMTSGSVVYKNYDPISGETYYEGFKSSLSFHRIRVQYDLTYRAVENGKLDFYVGGNFACNTFLQFENYPSITGLFSVGPTCAINYQINERNSVSLMGSMPLFGFGVRPPYAGCDAQLMKYAEEDFLKIFTLGHFLSIHNYQSVFLDFSYKLKANDWFSLGMGFDCEYSRIAEPKERPFYYLNGNFKTFGTFSF